MKHRYRNEDDKHVVTIEDDDGKVVDRHVYAHYEAAMAARDEACAEGLTKLRGGTDGRSRKPKAAKPKAGIASKLLGKK